MDPSIEPEDPTIFETFLDQRGKILEEIKEFLTMVLTYFYEVEKNFDLETVFRMVHDNLESSVKNLMKSLCLLHGLYIYPKEANRLAGVNKDAVRNILLNTVKKEVETKDKGHKTIRFADYCGQEIYTTKFWNFTFGDEFSPESLPREPAHCFLELVREMFNSSEKNEVATVGREVLETLRDRNGLKPRVWAHEKKQEINFGVSLGVRSFVRPLYLCIKLTQLSNSREKCKLKGVKAIKIAYKDMVKNPCVSCQYSFGFQSIPVLGNCAEYDVIGNVNHRGLLGTEEWSEFRSRCEQHFDAFNDMVRNLDEEQSIEDKLKEYHSSTRNPEKPKILRYKWNSEGGFELKLQVWPPKSEQ